MDAVMPNPALPRLRVAVMAMGLLMLLGCTAPPPEPAAKVLTADEAAARTVVPLTRPIALDKAGQVVDLEFELPPAEAGLAPQLLIGVRVAGDEEAADKALWLLNGYDLMAKVRLSRADGADAAPLSLTRYDAVSRKRVPLDANGLVPQAIAISPASGPLQAAGLVSPALHYGSLGLAFLPEAKPGHYRLSIELPEDRPELKNMNVELLVGYMGSSK